jgi:hypothetical protein
MEIKVTDWTGEEITCQIKEEFDLDGDHIYVTDKSKSPILHPSRYTNYLDDYRIAYIGYNKSTGRLKVMAQHKVNGKWGGRVFQINCKEAEIGSLVFVPIPTNI